MREDITEIIQDPEASCSKEELAAYDVEIARLRESLPELKAELKSKQAKLAFTRSAPSNDGLRASVFSLEAQKAEAEARLATLRSGSVKPVSDIEKEAIDKDHRKWRGIRERRKRGFLEIEGLLLDTGTITKDDLWVRADSATIPCLFTASIFGSEAPSDIPIEGTNKRKMVTGMGLEENATKVGGRNWNWVRKRVCCWFRLDRKSVV